MPVQLSEILKTSRSLSAVRKPLAWRAISAAIALALAGGTMLAQAEAPVTAQTHSAVPGSLPGMPGFADVVERVSPAVVNIAVTSTRRGDPMGFRSQGMPDNLPVPEFFRRFFDERGEGVPHQTRGLGSGFIIAPEGYVVTNNHVIDGASEVSVIMNDGTSYPASIVGRDDKSDVALLKIDAKHPLPYAELGDSSKARVGDWVLAVGNPFGLGGSVNAGIISARGRDIHSGPYDDYLQIDAAINRGNSGGPLFDTTGKVIGMNTAIFSPTGGNVGIGFAIPAETVKRVTSDLRANGKVERGWLGVQIQSVTPDLAAGLGLDSNGGVLVADVVPGGPASATDLQVGDVIVRAAGKKLERAHDLPKLVAAAEAGSTMELDVLRDGKPRQVIVTVGRMPDGNPASGVPRQVSSAAEGASHLGLLLAPINDQLRQQRGLNPDTEGVYVAGVLPNSPAEEAGIEPGSIISMVGAQRVDSPEQLQAAVRKATDEQRGSVILRVERGDKALFLAVPLSE